MVCKRHSEGSLRPLQNWRIAWGDMPNRLANSTQLTFFPSSLSAAVAAIHTFLVSLLFVFFKVRHKKKPHRPFQGSEADRLFCCFAGRGAGTRPCGSSSANIYKKNEVHKFVVHKFVYHRNHLSVYPVRRSVEPTPWFMDFLPNNIKKLGLLRLLSEYFRNFATKEWIKR